MLNKDELDYSTVFSVLMEDGDRLSDELVLELGHYYLEHCGNAFIAKLAKEMISSKRFSLNGGDFKREPMADIETLLVLYVTVLRSRFEVVELTNLKIDDKAAAVIAGALKRNNTTKSLSMWSNEIGDEGAAALATVLAEHHTLMELNLDNNRINDDGLIAFSNCFKVNTKLNGFSLSGGSFTARSLMVLADSLMMNQTIIRVHVCHAQLAMSEIDTQQLHAKIDALMSVNYSLCFFTIGNTNNSFIKLSDYSKARLDLNGEILYCIKSADDYINNRVWGNDVYVRNAETQALRASFLAGSLQSHENPVARSLAARLLALAVNVGARYYDRHITWVLRKGEFELWTFTKIAHLRRLSMHSLAKLLPSMPRSLAVAVRGLPSVEANKLYDLAIAQLDDLFSKLTQDPHYTARNALQAANPDFIACNELRAALDESLFELRHAKSCHANLSNPTTAMLMSVSDCDTRDGKFERFLVFDHAYKFARIQSSNHRYNWSQGGNAKLFMQLATALLDDNGALIDFGDYKNNIIAKQLLKLVKQAEVTLSRPVKDIPSVIKYFLLTELLKDSLQMPMLENLTRFDKEKVNQYWNMARDRFHFKFKNTSTPISALPIVRACELSVNQPEFRATRHFR